MDVGQFPGMPNETSCYWKKPIPEHLPHPDEVSDFAWHINWEAAPFMPETAGVRIIGYRLADGRLAPHYTQIGDFPESRIVPLDYRLMKFYTWFWKKGDGWNGFQNAVSRIFRRTMGRPLVSFYDPIVRTPPLWGSGGTELTWGNQWTCSYPEPYNIAFVIAEQQAMARGVEGMGGIFACRALFDLAAVVPGHGYAFTNPDTMPVISNLFTTVGRELGPLFKAVPEREPTVAYLESYALTFSRTTRAGAGTGRSTTAA